MTNKEIDEESVGIRIVDIELLNTNIEMCEVQKREALDACVKAAIDIDEWIDKITKLQNDSEVNEPLIKEVRIEIGRLWEETDKYLDVIAEAERDKSILIIERETVGNGIKGDKTNDK